MIKETVENKDHGFIVLQFAAAVFLLFLSVKLIYLGPKLFLTSQTINSLKEQIVEKGKTSQNYLMQEEYGLAQKEVRSILDQSLSASKSLTCLGQDIGLLLLIPSNSKSIEQQKLAMAMMPAVRKLNDIISRLPSLEVDRLTEAEGSILDLYGLHEVLPDITSWVLQEKPKLIESLSSINLPEARVIEAAIAANETKLTQLDFVAKKINWIFGGSGGKRDFLVIFQNNDELRGGSGGSFGSFGIAKFENGKLLKIDFGTNIYKLDNAFKEKQKITPPSELEAFGDAWTMKHAGFAVDGKEALDKIRWFYHLETGQSVDGAITIDTTFFTSLLRVLGPISMPEFGLTLDADNFVRTTEYEVQEAYFERPGGMTENEPKKILGAMMPEVISRTKSLAEKKEGRKQLGDLVAKALSEKNILFNVSDQATQDYLNAFNWTGQVQNYPEADYLYINNSNLAGDKTNQSMKETINMTATISSTGEVVNSIELIRQHTKPKVWPNGLDRNYTRVLLPKNSDIQSFAPLEGNFQRYYDRGYKNNSPYWIDKEAERTTLNFWMSTQPLETSRVKFRYKTAYKIDTREDFTYKLLIQRQPGAPADNLDLTVGIPAGFLPVNKSLITANNSIRMKVVCNTDKLITIEFKKK